MADKYHSKTTSAAAKIEEIKLVNHRKQKNLDTYQMIY